MNKEPTNAWATIRTRQKPVTNHLKAVDTEPDANALDRPFGRERWNTPALHKSLRLLD